MNKKQQKFFYYIFFSLFFLGMLFFIRKNVIDYYDAKEVRNNPVFTKGSFVKFSDAGGEGYNVLLMYKYIVNKIEYKREFMIKTGSSNFEYCLDNDNIEWCQRKRFWVIYSRKNPDKSLIDLSKEIQDENDPKPPVNIDNFQ